MHFNKLRKYTQHRKRGGLQGTRFRGLGIPNPARIIKSPKYRRPSTGHSFPGISIAVLLAGLFFLASAVSFLLYMGDGGKQAEHLLRKVYTVNQYQWKDAVAAAELPAASKFYKKEFGSFMTESGIRESMETSLPYGLLRRHSPVDRTYAGEPELTELTKGTALTELSEQTELSGQTGVGRSADETSQTPADDENGAHNKVKEYTYYIPVDTYYIKGEAEVQVQPVAKEYYEGTIRIKKTGLFRWKLDGITGKQQQF